MKKYWLVFGSAWQTAFSYRGSLIFKAIADVLFTISFILLWSVVYQNTSEIAGMTFPDIVTYYILVRILNLAYTLYPAKFLTNQIKTGKFSTFLVKPVNYFNYTVANTLGLKLARESITFCLVLFFIIFFPQYIVYPPNLIYVLALIPFVIMSWLIYAEIGFLIGILAFWVSDTGNIRSASDQIIALLGGGWIPLAFFPAVFLSIINLLPFKFLYSFVISLFQGKIPLKELPMDFVICAFWVISLWLLGRHFFAKGVRRYEAYGN